MRRVSGADPWLSDMAADDRLKEYRKAHRRGSPPRYLRGLPQQAKARSRRLERRQESRSRRPRAAFPRLAPRLGLALFVLASALAAAPPAGATPPGERGQIAPATWSSLASIDDLLRKGGWRRAARWTDDILEETSRRKWREPDLDRILATLTVYRAVLAAHRGEERAALWSWHMALNLDPAQGERDLAPSGAAAELFGERRLRAAGRPPPGLVVPEPFGSGPGYEPTVPALPERAMALVNPHFARERVPTVQVEVVVGVDGGLGHPVVTTPWAPPVAIWWALESMGHGVPFEPARLDGQAVPAFYVLEQDFSRAGRF